MLEKVKKALRKQEPPYEEYFNQFLMDLQDYNLASEIMYNVKHNSSDILDIERLAQEQHERLVTPH